MKQPAIPDRLLTAEEFHDWHWQQEGHFELSDGQVVPRFGWEMDAEGRWTMMTGGRVRHGQVAGNVLVSLARQLRGSGCEVFGSDVAVRTGPRNVRYPEVSVLCDRDELAAINDDTPEITNPKLVVEVLSKSTQKTDRGDKLFEYKSIASVQAIVLIHPVQRWLDVYVRQSPTEFRNFGLLQGATLVLEDPAVTLTAEEIFDFV